MNSAGSLTLQILLSTLKAHSKLRWDRHVEQVKAKVLRALGLIKHANKLLPHNAKVTMYADDNSISYSPKSVAVINSTINDDLSNLKLWLEGNKLSLTVRKTQAILIGSRPKLQNNCNSDGINLKFVIDDEVFPMINEAKYLGITLVLILRFTRHSVIELCGSMSYALR